MSSNNNLSEPKVFVIIPVYNRLKYTKKCLNSLKKQTYKNFTVILVDAGSSDSTAEVFKRNYPHWILISGSSKWWWTRSINEGVKFALKSAKQNDFILSMNNDCFFDKKYLKRIVSTALNNYKSMVGSLILSAEKKKEVVGAGVKIAWKKNLIYDIAGTHSTRYNYFHKRSVIRGLDTLPGKGTLIPVKVFKKVGLFNQVLFPHYLADYEFATRANQNGFNLIVDCKAEVFNFTEKTGEYLETEDFANIKRLFYLLFARKSKNNLLDIFFFYLLRSPKEYKLKNIYNLTISTLNRVRIINKFFITIQKIRGFILLPVHKKKDFIGYKLKVYLKNNF